MPSIMDLFSASLAVPNAPAVPAGGSPTLEGNTGNNGQVPPQNQPKQQEQEPKPQESPLDKFSTLWEPPKQDTSQEPVQLSEIDPAKLSEMVSKMDFIKSLPPDIMTRVQAGGEDAAVALKEAMQGLGTSVFAQNTMVTAKLIDNALKQQREHLLGQIPALVKKQALGESLSAQNPVLNHPAAAPLIQALQNSLAAKFPTATSAELTTLASEYLTNFAKGLTAPADKASQELQDKKTATTDWSKFLPDHLNS